MVKAPYLHAICVFILCLAITIVGCTKDKRIDAPGKSPDPQKPIETSFYTSLKSDSVEQLSMVITYQLNKPANSTGLVVAFDSLSLTGDNIQYTHQNATLHNSSYYIKIVYPYNLQPPTDKLWFRIYMIGSNSEKTYSPILNQTLATYQIKNKYVVNGKAAFNNHPKDFFMNYEGTAIGALDNSLIIDAITTDVNAAHYKGTINNVAVSLSRIDVPDYPPTHRLLLFDVPDDQPLGSAKFDLYYLNKLVYSVNLTIVNGGLLSLSKYTGPAAYSCYFESGGKLYVYNNYASPDPSLYSWTPETSAWQKLPNSPPQSFATSPFVNNNARISGQTINGIVYFPPFYIRPYNDYSPGNDNYYEEVIASYNPNNGQWKQNIVFHTTNQAEDRSLMALDCFVVNNKLYCITSESVFSEPNGASKYQLRVFDPENNKWDYYMSLPDKFFSLDAVVNNDKIYLLATRAGKQESASSEYINEFFQLDINSKTVIKKNWILDREVGVKLPYVVSFNNKIYVYGGYDSNGYTSLYSSLFAVYDPNANKWSPVSGYSYFTGWVSQTDGFLLPINKKLYLGLGLDVYTNGNIYGAKRKNSIYNLSIK